MPPSSSTESPPGGRPSPLRAALLALALSVALAPACAPDARRSNAAEVGGPDTPAGPDGTDLPADTVGHPIASVAFDWATHRRLAPGSDNWPLTWSADGHQYTSWGDGGGFGGTNNRYRVSLGVARIEGSADDYEGTNVWGHPDNAESRAMVEGKSYGILALGDTLHLWVSPGSGEDNWTRARLHHSGDGGRTWTPSPVELVGARDSLGVPAFLQQGQDHAWSRDGYVYVYATGIRTLEEWEVQVPGALFLLRAPADSLSDANAWRTFAGMDSTDAPLWSASVRDRRPVLEDASGLMRHSALYVAPLRRYVLVTDHSLRNGGNVAIYDAPDPWGPWREVLRESAWGEGHVAPNTFYWVFAPAWLGPDGRDFVLVFTGKEENDSWNSVRGRFETR